MIRDYDAPAAGAVITDLIESLNALNEHTDGAIRVQWNDGIVSGQKIGNSKLKFVSGDMGIELIFYDSPGGSKIVTLTRSVAERAGNPGVAARP